MFPARRLSVPLRLLAPLALATLVWSGCSDSEQPRGDAGIDAGSADGGDGGGDLGDAGIDAGWDAGFDAGMDGGADAADAGDGEDDGGGQDAGFDAGDDGGPISYVIQGELVTSGQVPVTQAPPTWNAHLSKLASDGEYLYVAHTHYPAEVENRSTHIMVRPWGSPGEGFGEVATLYHVHQPPGIVMDTSGRLHMVFDCLRAGGVATNCFQGGAGTGDNLIRFYHLIFSAHQADGVLRFDTYQNYNEWTAETNGYHGLGTTADGYTWWSLMDSSYRRQVQWWYSSDQYGTLNPLSLSGVYLLYPIHACHPDTGSDNLLLFLGKWDPNAGNNAAYLGSIAYRGALSLFDFTQLVDLPALMDVTTGGFPSDVSTSPDGSTTWLLNYRPKPSGECNELLQYPADLSGSPEPVDVGCTGTYTTLQVSRSGVLYTLSPASAGKFMRLRVSRDQGLSWTEEDVPIQGLPDNGDTRYVGITAIKPYTSPMVYDPDRMVFFFSGRDDNQNFQHSYLGELQLE